MKTTMRKGVAALAAAAVTSLTACAGIDDGADEASFGYLVSTPLVTTNAGTLEGRSTQAQLLSTALYPGVYVPGPQGQMIPNTDLVTTQELPGPERRVNYSLSQEAVFSDGTPVTCSDYLLAFTAGTHPALFGSSMPLFDDTAQLTCTPGSKDFTVIFKEGRGARWRGLFEAGTVLPAHAVAKQLELSVDELVEELESEDADRLRPIADVWRGSFNLDNFDEELQTSFGPYTIDRVGDDGEVVLRANEHYYGDAPAEPEIVVWPGSADAGALAESGELVVGDLRDHTPEWFDSNAEDNRLEVSTVAGQLTEVLQFPEVGTWAVEENRQALSRCIDPRAVADAASSAAGIAVPVAPLHVLQNDDPLAKRLDDAVQPRLDVDVERARALEGAEVRIGYAYPSKRYAAMVEAMRRSCEPAGVTIVDATGDGKSLADLPRAEIGEWGEEVAADGTIDAFIYPADPMTSFPAALNKADNLGVLRAQEIFLWDRLPTIPLIAQPVTFAIDREVSNVVAYTGLSGIGWNVNRWQRGDHPTHKDET
ncbi:ABC transporter substrate-binding protein [Corynebacterium sp. Marseille-Q4381]|uniref:ABC transporter substrate-binding protein n=1 Tax=Corynebacterium sp. Marseille-Q4381 TaxID=3121597 RepID=UPI002FE5BF08